jgi:serine/threonine protein kinase
VSDISPANDEALARRVDQACNHFEIAWRTKRRPRIEDFVAELGEPERSAALRELIPLDLYYRRCEGESPTLAEYRECFPGVDLHGLTDEHPTPVGSDPTSAWPGAPNTTGNHPQQLGEYRIVREIGRGGMGVVYEAEQESLGRRVALKVLASHAVIDERHRQRFQREARAAARLHHTNIVPVHGVGEQDGLHYYVMQFIEGKGLHEVVTELARLRPARRDATPTPVNTDGTAAHHRELAAAMAESLVTGGFAAGHIAELGSAAPDRETPPEPHQEPLSTAAADTTDSKTDDTSSRARLPGQTPGSSLSESRWEYWRSIARIGVQVAEALAYAANQGILHRDIKPSNLLLDTRGTVWVTDFGLAKIAADEANLTDTGDIIGTLRYMAPERFQGRADARSDLYALGLTLYELLTLRPAFDAEERSKLIAQVLHDEPARPRQIEASVPRDLETIVLKATARDPGHRYQTPDEMAEDLQRFLDDRPIKARRLSLVQHAWRWCRRNPAVASLSAMLSLVVLGSLVVLTFLYVDADAQRRRAEGAEANWQAAAEKAIEEERNAKNAATKARAEESNARESGADTEAFSNFLVRDVLAAARPKGQAGGQGSDVTVWKALDAAAPKIEKRFAGRPLAEAKARTSLGETYFFLGDFEAAIVQCARALELRRAKLGPDHADTLSAMANLALVTEKAGRPEEALPLQLESVRLMKAKLGPDHRDTLTAMNNLAITYLYLGRPDDAAHAHQEALEILKAKRGSDHPDTLRAMNNLAAAYEVGGRPNDALPIYEEVLRIRKESPGMDHPDTLMSMNNLGGAYLSAGRLKEAEALLRETLDRRRKVLPAEHPSLSYSLESLSHALLDLKRPEEAEPLARECLAIRERQFAPRHKDTASARSLVGACLAGQRRFTAAEPLLLEGYQGLVRAKATPFNLKPSLERIVQLYVDWDRPEEAKKWQAKLPPPEK